MEGRSLPIDGAATFAGMAHDIEVHGAVNVLSFPSVCFCHSMPSPQQSVWLYENISALQESIPLHVTPASS